MIKIPGNAKACDRDLYNLFSADNIYGHENKLMGDAKPYMTSM